MLFPPFLLSSFFFLSSLPLFLPHSFPSFPSFLSSFLTSFLPSLSLLLSRYSYQSPAMENTEFLLAHWYCAGVDFSALWTDLSETTWSVPGGHWHFINTAWWPVNLKCPIFFTDLNWTKQWNKKWTKKKCKRQRKKEGREGRREMNGGGREGGRKGRKRKKEKEQKRKEERFC